MIILLTNFEMFKAYSIMTIFCLDNPFGYVCYIQCSESMQVPDNEKTFSDVLILLAVVLNFKILINYF